MSGAMIRPQVSPHAPDCCAHWSQCRPANGPIRRRLAPLSDDRRRVAGVGQSEVRGGRHEQARAPNRDCAAQDLSNLPPGETALDPETGAEFTKA